MTFCSIYQNVFLKIFTLYKYTINNNTNKNVKYDCNFGLLWHIKTINPYIKYKIY